MGTAYDLSCLHWSSTCSGEGNCTLYNPVYLRHAILVLAFFTKSTSIACLFCAWYFYKSSQTSSISSADTDYQIASNVSDQSLKQDQFSEDAAKVKATSSPKPSEVSQANNSSTWQEIALVNYLPLLTWERSGPKKSKWPTGHMCCHGTYDCSEFRASHWCCIFSAAGCDTSISVIMNKHLYIFVDMFQLLWYREQVFYM